MSFLSLDHSYVLADVRRPGGLPIEGGTGILRFGASSGLTYELNLPLSATAAVCGRDEGLWGVGQTRPFDRKPSWLATGPDGGAIEIIEVQELVSTTSNETRTGTEATYTGGHKITGRAAYARVEIRSEVPFAFYSDTPPLARALVPHFRLFRWPIVDKIAVEVPGAIQRRARSCIVLGERPWLAAFRCSLQSSSDEEAAWLCWDEDGSSLFEFPEFCDLARHIVSLFVGVNCPFIWRDRFTSPRSIERVYHYAIPYEKYHGDEQPVPLKGTLGLQHVESVVPHIRPLFERYQRLKSEYQIPWLLGPLWACKRVWIEERLGLACVALERLSTAFAKVRESRPDLRPFTDEQYQAIRDAVTTAAAASRIEGESLTILGKKLDNFNQPTNKDKLSQVFEGNGIQLTNEERAVISQRNDSLHGRRTLSDAEDNSAVNDEVRRFDIIRTLLHRAMLAILGYNGVYIDYGARPETGEFPVKGMP